MAKFICGDCGFAADDERDMDLHMSKHDKGSGIMTCTECGFYTGNSKRFAEHDKTAHGSGIAKEIKTKLKKAYGPDFKKKIKKEIKDSERGLEKSKAQQEEIKCETCGKKIDFTKPGYSADMPPAFAEDQSETKYYCAKCTKKREQGSALDG